MPGAAVGMHSVTISPVIEAPNAAPAKDPQLPKAWRDGSKRFTVPPGGTHEANFEIVGDDKAPRRARLCKVASLTAR